MVSATRAIRTVSRTAVDVVRVLIIKVKLQRNWEVHTFDPLADPIVAIEDKSLGRWEQYLVGRTSITPAAIVDAGIFSVISIWKWMHQIVLIAIIFIIPEDGSILKSRGTGASIASNAVVPFRPGESTPRGMGFCTVVASKVPSQVNFQVAVQIGGIPIVVVAVIFIVLVSPPTEPVGSRATTCSLRQRIGSIWPLQFNRH